MTTESYTHGHHESVLRSHTWRTVDNSAAYAAHLLVPGASVLDVGCGPGTITVDIAERVAPGRVVGLDAAEDVITSASELGASFGNVEFVVGNAYELDYPDDSFDLVHAHQTLQHLARPVDALREFRRVVKPGGVVAVRDVDYAGTVVHPRTEGIALWEELYQKVHRSNGGEPDAGRRLKQWALEAGFGDVVATASIWTFSTDADRAWWGGMWADRVLQSAFAGDALAKGLATQAELELISRAWTAWAADANGFMAMPHGEVLARA
jgi:ubiquinone/menaquinone biosynthesis C-methylase UbiE